MMQGAPLDAALRTHASVGLSHAAVMNEVLRIEEELLMLQQRPLKVPLPRYYWDRKAKGKPAELDRRHEAMLLRRQLEEDVLPIEAVGPAFIQMGRLYASLGEEKKWAKACRDAIQAVAEDKVHSEAHDDLWRFHLRRMQLHDSQRAVTIEEHLDVALSLTKEHKQKVILHDAVKYLSGHPLLEACRERLLKELCAMEGNPVELLQALALRHIQQKNYGEAVQCIQMYIGRVPSPQKASSEQEAAAATASNKASKAGSDENAKASSSTVNSKRQKDRKKAGQRRKLEKSKSTTSVSKSLSKSTSGPAGVGISYQSSTPSFTFGGASV